MFRSPTRFTLVLLLVLGSASAAQAQARGNFDDADSDHDGHVTWPEYQTYLTQRLTAADGPIAQRFKQLSPDEQVSRLKERFDRLDAAHKGYLDRKDWGAS